MKTFKTLAMVAVAGCVFAGAEAAQAGPFDFLNPLSWGNNSAYSNPSFSTGTICGPNGCYTNPNCANGQCAPNGSMNCVNGQCFPSYSQPYGSTYVTPTTNYTGTTNYMGTSNCPGGVCPPTTNYYRMPSTTTTTPVYNPPVSNSYSRPVVQPVSGSSNVPSPFYN